ncbi:MAG: tRNA epoxyqueuosine(34) reductase QueG [Thermoanaerobaculia bacterium]|nr:tRNA epoxyqueuosine(34) reductase QueG [Thermoanaerobaculia bacterium]
MGKDRREDLLKRWAIDAGFDRAGIARLGPSEHGEALERWLERGDHAEMGWMERRVEVRRDPRRLLDGARSALCVALQYHPHDGGEEIDGDLWPGVARYARGEDYHRVMGERLERLAERIEQAFPGARSRAYVDTGPVLERELAQRAGLGAIGKNTNLLDPEAGSWFLLGELLLTLELAEDAAVGDLCGSCTACLDACPTDALPQPYRLDSRSCISYWTIEHRGPIPRRVRPSLGRWVFGCDVCQEVCPVNEAPLAAREERLRLPVERRRLGLVELLELTRDEYVERFRHSPMKRAKLEGLKRNAAVTMGNSGDRRYVPALGRALTEESDATVRGHAAWALGRLGGDAAQRALGAAWRAETEVAVRDEIAAARERLAGAATA